MTVPLANPRSARSTVATDAARADVGSYSFAPSERGLVPGSPYTPALSARRRLAYAAAALLTGVASTFPNALVTVNVPNLAGELGVYVSQLIWLPAIYVAFNATANLTIIKARAQFGVPQVTNTLLLAYALASVVQLFAPSFVTAVLTRAINGMASAALITISIYYLLQALPAKLRPLSLVFGVSLTQLGPALARTIPVELLSAEHWRGLHLLELAVAFAALAALTAVPLPPSDRIKAFESLDFVIVALVVPAMLLVCGVLSAGRVFWWTDTPWLGWALAAAVPLFTAAFLVEHYRTRPLLQTRWIGTLEIIRFVAVALLVRIALAEQTYGSVGLLTSGGLTNDQLRLLFALVASAMLLGMIVAALTLSVERLPYQVMAAALIIAFAAWLDSHATNLTRPSQLYLSQTLIGFGTTLFIGPALADGFLRMMSRGVDHFVTVVVLFSTTQNVGGLAGSALLGTYQMVAARSHATALSEHLTGFDPQVAARIQSGVSTLAGAVVDPLARSAQGAGLLGQTLNREANTLAFNDTFSFVAALAILTAAYVAYTIVFNKIRRRRSVGAEVKA
jgi:MFS family permease